jgi:hypothetical protein
MKRLYYTENLTPILVIFAIILLLFTPWWLEHKACAPLDIATNLYEPWSDTSSPIDVHNHHSTDSTEHYLLYRDFAQKSMAEEGRIGWNPLKGGGTAEYANSMATPGDFTYLFFRFLPYWHASNLGLMVQYLIAMLGMFIFLRHQRFSVWLAFAGAIAYGLNTHFAGWIFHRWALGGFCWTPWFLWALNGLRQRERIGMFAPLFIAASFVGGHIQYAGFQALVCIAFTVGWYLDIHKESNELTLRPLWTMTTIGIVATLIASFTLLPSAYAFHVTMQSGLVRGGLGYPNGMLAVLKNAIAYPSYVFPVFYGTSGSFDLGRILSTGLFSVPFFGSLFAIAAVFGLFIPGLSRTAKTLVVFGLILPLTPLVGPLYQRLLMLYILGGIWLAIDAISECSDRQYASFTKIAKTLFFTVLITSVVIGVAMTMKHDAIREVLKNKIMPSVTEHRFGARPDWFEFRIDKLINSLKITNLRIWLSLVAFAVSIFMLPYRKRAFFGPVISLCILVQLWIPHKEWMTFVTPPNNSMNKIYPITEEIQAIKDAVGEDGRVVVAQSVDKLPLFPPNTLTYFNIVSLNVYDSFLPNGMEPHNNYNPFLENLKSAEFYGSIGVSHLVTFNDMSPVDSAWSLQTIVGKIAIYSNKFVRARYEAFSDVGEKQILKPVVKQRNFRKLVLPSKTTKLSICENHAQGWEYRLNGDSWQDLERASDGSMEANFTSRDQNTSFEMRYNPGELILGKTLTYFGFALFLIFSIIYLRSTCTAEEIAAA